MKMQVAGIPGDDTDERSVRALRGIDIGNIHLLLSRGPEPQFGSLPRKICETSLISHCHDWVFGCIGSPLRLWFSFNQGEPWAERSR